MRNIKINKKDYKISNELELLEGMEFKSFRQFTNYLGLEFPRTATDTINSIKRQLEKYFEWEPIGTYSIRITKIRSADDIELINAKAELAKIPVRSSKTTYAKATLPLLAAALKPVISQTSEEYLYLEVTNRQFYEQILLCHPKLFNDNFVTNGWKEEFPHLAALEHSQLCMDNIVLANRNKANQILKDLKKYLVENHIVSWNDSYRITTIENKTIIASQEEIACCLESIRYAFNTMNVFSMYKIYKSNRYEEFKKIAFEYSAKKFKIISFKAINQIISTKINIREFLQLAEQSLELQQKQLNTVILNSLVKSENKLRIAQEEPILPPTDVSTFALRIALGFYTLPEFSSNSYQLHSAYRMM